MIARRLIVTLDAVESVEDLGHLREPADTGRLRPVIGDIRPLDDIAVAHARADSGRKVGAAIIRNLRAVSASGFLEAE